MSRTTSSAISRRARSSAATSTSGPLIDFGSSPSPQADAVLLERADDERVRGQAEALAGRAAQLGRRRGGKCSRSMPIGMRCTRAGSTPAEDDDLLHLPVRHLDAREPRVIAPQRLERAVELRVARRPRPAVEVREAEPVRRARPARVERLEVARVEDGLAAGEPRPGGRREPVPGRGARRAETYARLVVERPAERVADDEEARVVGHLARPQADRARAGDRRRRAEHATRRHPRSTSR